MKNVHITSLGCAKNLVDSEVLRGQLKHNSFCLIEEPEEADIIIINTCGFIEDAKNESLQAIFEAVELKKDDKQKKVYVIGCLSKRYKDELVLEIPEIDGFFGTEDYENILRTLNVTHFNSQDLFRLRKLTTPNHYAYLKISEGCNQKCAFCAIPSIRGPYRSRSIEDILFEAENIARQGVKELILISQDTTYYGKDLYRKQRILDLVQKLAELKLFSWIRLMYWHPNNFPLEYLSLMTSYDRIVPYLDIPIQHISDRVLKFMRRAESKKYLKELFTKIRSLNPDIALRTTLIIGHPGETDDDFNQLEEFIKEIEFDRLGAFIYSDEEGTNSFLLKNKVDRGVALDRYEKIMGIQQKISLKKNKDLVDLKQIVLIDSYNNKIYIGRTFRDAPEIDNEVIIASEKRNPEILGEFMEIEITDYSEYELYGKIIQNNKKNRKLS